LLALVLGAATGAAQQIDHVEPGRGVPVAPQVALGWASSIRAALNPLEPNPAAMAPILASLASLDLRDPAVRSSLQPVAVQLQAAAQDFITTAAPLPAGASSSAPNRKYSAMMIDVLNHPAVAAQLDDELRARVEKKMSAVAAALGRAPEPEDSPLADGRPLGGGIPTDVRAARRLSSAPKPSPPRWIPSDPAEIRALDQRLAEEEESIVSGFAADPARFFLKIRKQSQESLSTGGDFSYTVFEPVLRRIMLDLALRTREDLRPDDRSLFLKLMEEGDVLLHASVPYKDTMRFVFRYLDALDGVFVRLHPEFAASFHRDNAERVLEPTLGRAPDALLYPSFRPVNIDYFVNTRGAPFHIVGLHTSGLRPGEPVPFADGFSMKPSEFAWHDIGHIEFMAERDFAYQDGSFKPLERIVQEWDLTRRRVVGYWSSFQEDKNLHDAMGLLLFEILHERGYQYSFAVLKAQLDTPKWIEILMRKRDNDYYKVYPDMNMAMFPELENARKALLRFVDESRRNDQKRHVAALFGEELAVRVTHFPKVRYGRGTLDRIEIGASSDAKVIVRGAGGETSAPDASGLILAQVNPTPASPFDAKTRARIGAALGAKKSGKTIALEGRKRRIAKIVVLPTKEVLVEFAGGVRAPLASTALPEGLAAAPEAPQDRQFFELEQVLGSHERGQTLSFTTQDPAKVYIGTVRYVLKSGEEMIVVRDEEGAETTLPLAEVLIDPLQKGDFLSSRRRKK
jgi:hypothetical protein